MSASSEQSTLEQRLESIARAAVASRIAPGLQIAVARGERIIFTRGYGLANVEEGVSVQTGTVFRIGSLAKQFTAAAIMRLVDQGRVSLDDQITRFLPGYPTPDSRLSVSHLLNHTSGIRDYTQSGPPWTSRVGEDLAHQDVLALFQDAPLDFAPGERFRYTNSGYFLLGMIIERVTGQPYGDFVHQELTNPLGLENTTYCPNEPADGHASGFRSSPSGPVPAPQVSMTHVFYAAGALCSTAVDLVKWAQALASGRIVSPASYQRMITPGTLVGGAPLHYGYGIVPGEFFGATSIAHAGGHVGFSAALSYYPEEDLAVAVLANQEGANTARILDQLSLAVLGLEEAPVHDLIVPSTDRSRYVGSYDVGGAQIQVGDDGERLMIQGLGPLLAQGHHEFRARAEPSTRVTFRFEGEQAASLTVHQTGGVIEARRAD